MLRRSGIAPLLLGACALGIAAGSLRSLSIAAVLLLAVGLFTWAIGSHTGPVIAVVAFAVAGIAVGAARTEALQVVPVRAGKLPEGSRALVQETPRAERFGWRAAAEVNGNRLLLRGPGRTPAWSAGQIVLVAGAVRPPGPKDRWLEERRVQGIARVRPGPAVGNRGGLPGLVDGVRWRAGRALTVGLGPRPSALLRGMVLGDDAEMDPGLRDGMRRVGLGHVVAASGANIAILAALVFGACALLGAGFRTRLALCGAAIALYAPLCGSGPSIVRASVGGLAVLAAAAASRPTSRWQGLLIAAVVTLAFDPLSWRDVGWQLSYAAVVGIALLAGPARSWLLRRGLPAWAADGIAVTFAATTATAPVSAAAFGTLSPVALPVNVAAAPLVAAATWLGMAAAALGQLDPRLGLPFVEVARWPVAGLLALVALASRIPFAQVGAGPVVAMLIALAGVAAVGASRGPRWRVPCGMTAVAALAAIPAWSVLKPAPGPGAPPDGGTRVSFLDVGQGDATLFQSRGRSLLVDAGSSGAGVVERLREAGVERLDTLLVTHAQADHLGGAVEVLRALPVGLLADGRGGVSEPAGQGMVRAAAERGVPTVDPRAGDRFRVGGLAVEVLWPSGRGSPGSDPNLRCVVLRVSAPGAVVLLGGDAESEVLEPLHPGPVDILKVSHHGSVDPGLPALLEETRPRLAVIEVGAQNSYGHPSPATLSQLLRSGARVMRTDRDGTVRVDLARGRMRVLERP